MENNKKIPGSFLMELVTETDGISCTLWVSNINNPCHTRGFEFIGVEAGSVLETLDNVYRWIDELGYLFSKSEIIVFNLQEFTLLLGKQGEESFWFRDFCDFVSYFAGAMGMPYADASDALIRPLMGLVGEARYRKMESILLQLGRQAISNRNLLAKMNERVAVAADMHMMMATSRLSEEIWRQP